MIDHPFRAAFYKGTRPELIAGAFNRVVRAKDRGPYSHMELVFPDGVSWSSSFMDGGVRQSTCARNPGRWDFVDLPPHLESPARAFFLSHEGANYDTLGIAFQTFGFFRPHSNKWFCSEICLAALGYRDSWRFTPNAAYSILCSSAK